MEGDMPSPFVSVLFRSSGSCVSVGICALLYMTAFFGVQMFVRMKEKHNREIVECHKKVWIMALNIMAIYCYNNVSVATVIILWACTIAHIGALALCVLDAERAKYFKFVMSAALALSAINWIIHVLTRTFTTGRTGLGGFQIIASSSYGWWFQGKSYPDV